MSSIAKSIQMIAWFDREGKINPIKFKYEEDCENKVIFIKKILSRDYEKLGGNPMWKFNCSSVINGIEVTYIIKYEMLKGKWFLFGCNKRCF